MPTSCSLTGLGGGTSVQITCSGCGVSVSYSSSAVCDQTHRQAVVSVALRLATFISGIGFAGYHKLLKRHLGMHIVNQRHFIEMAYPHVKDILDICELGKAEMKCLPSTELGSWEKAVTTSDGCWHIRGFFSQNSTFIIRNYFTGALLRYVLKVCVEYVIMCN